MFTAGVGFVVYLLQKLRLCNSVCLINVVIDLLQKLKSYNNVYVINFIHHYGLLLLLLHICFHFFFIFIFTVASHLLSFFFFIFAFIFFLLLHSLFLYIFFHFFFSIHLHFFFLTFNLAGVSLLQTTQSSFFNIINQFCIFHIHHSIHQHNGRLVTKSSFTAASTTAANLFHNISAHIW